MFRSMRRKRQALREEACQRILDRNTSGVLALLGDEGYPYAVPLSYVRAGNTLYFHCAKSGHKIDAMKQYNKASFCVIDRDDVVAEEYTSYFRSVIVFGSVGFVKEEAERRFAIELLAKKYHPKDRLEHRSEAIEKEYSMVCMIKLTIEHMSGKEAIELIKA